MKLFIWEDVRVSSESYHDHGGVVIVAEDPDGAEKAWIDSQQQVPFPSAPPDHAYEVVASAPKVLVFPDAGCC